MGRTMKPGWWKIPTIGGLVIAVLVVVLLISVRPRIADESAVIEACLADVRATAQTGAHAAAVDTHTEHHGNNAWVVVGALEEEGARVEYKCDATGMGESVVSTSVELFD